MADLGTSCAGSAITEVMKRTSLLFLFSFLISACHVGPGLTRVESNRIIRASETLNPYPILDSAGDYYGEKHLGPVLDRSLTPLILGPDEINPDDARARDYEENLRRQEEAIREMDREVGY
jgi:hypothetical protein